MNAATQQVLQDLRPGSDAQFFTDAIATQLTKSGLTIAMVLCITAAIYYFLCMLGVMGAGKRGLFAVVAVIAAGVGAFLLNEKVDALHVIDDSKPILAITSTKLDYDIRRVGWSIPWSNISTVELKTIKTFKKQSVEQTDYEIRVNVKPDTTIEWKYEPSIQNDMASVKNLFNSKSYLVIDPEPLGIHPSTLQMALEKVRAGL